MNVYYAQVVDNDSQNSPSGEKNGAIQFKIPSMMDGIGDSDLPWALPFHLSVGGSAEGGVSCIPEKDSLVWVFFHDEIFMKKAFYIADVNLKAFGPSTLFEDNVKSSIDGFSSEYPDIKFIYLKNKVSIAISSNDSNPEIAIYHPGGAYIFIDKDGKINIKGKTGSLEATVLGEQLKTKLEAILDAIGQITVTCASPGSPSGVPLNAASFSAIKAQLTQILSQSVKNS